MSRRSLTGRRRSLVECEDGRKEILQDDMTKEISPAHSLRNRWRGRTESEINVEVISSPGVSSSQESSSCSDGCHSRRAYGQRDVEGREHQAEDGRE